MQTPQHNPLQNSAPNSEGGFLCGGGLVILPGLRAEVARDSFWNSRCHRALTAKLSIATCAHKLQAIAKFPSPPLIIHEEKTHPLNPPTHTKHSLHKQYRNYFYRFSPLLFKIREQAERVKQIVVQAVSVFQEIPAPIKIKVALPPPLPNPPPPLKRVILWAWGVFQQKEPKNHRRP